MPLTPTFQSAFQSAYRSGFTHNAGVFNSKRLDLSTNHDSSDTTISDRSPYGNDATLKSGVYFSTNGLTDKGINADCSAAGSGTYKLTGKVRSSSTGTKYVTMDGATADTLTINTADVWEDFESSTFTGTPSNVVMGWDGGSNFSACDWSDIRLIDTLDGSTVSHFQGNESGAGDLDGKLVVDSSGNGYHGAHIGCAGGSAEGMDPVLAGLPGELIWFDGVDDYVNLGSFGSANNATITAKVVIDPSDTDQTLFSDSDGNTKFLGSIVQGSGLFPFGGAGSPSMTVDGNPVITRGALYNALSDRDLHTVVITGADISAWVDFNIMLWNANPVYNGKGVMYDITIDETSNSTIEHLYNGNGNTNAAWVDQIGSNDGTVNGSPITLATRRQTILQTAGQNANPWMGFTGWENGEDIESNKPKLTDVLLADRYSSTAGVNYDAVADADGIGGANSGNYCLKVTTPEALRGMAFVTPADDTTRQCELYYYVPTGQPNLELGNNATMALVPTLLSGNLTTKDAWTKIIFEWRVGVGNYGTAPWIGPAGAAGIVYFDDVTVTNPSIYIPQLDTDSTVDALGFPIAKPRPNNKVINLLADDAYSIVADDDSLDLTTVATWIFWARNVYKTVSISEFLFSSYGTISGEWYWAFLKSTQNDADEIRCILSQNSSSRNVADFGGVTDGFHHYAFVFDGSAGTAANNLKCYIDANEVSGSYDAGYPLSTLAASNQPVTIGASSAGAYTFNGKIGSPQIIKRALSAAEILARFNTTKAQYGL